MGLTFFTRMRNLAATIRVPDRRISAPGIVPVRYALVSCVSSTVCHSVKLRILKQRCNYRYSHILQGRFAEAVQ